MMIITISIAVSGSIVCDPWDGATGAEGIVVVVLIVVVAVVVAGMVFWKMPSIGSFGTTKETVHDVAFTEKGIIAIHVPLTISNGLIRGELIPHGYGDVTSVETFASVETLTLSALMSV